MNVVKWFGLSVAILASINGHAELLSYSFTDATGDQTRAGFSDLLEVSVLFDNSTGDYTITLTSTAEHPFQGWLLVNSNMVNPDTPEFSMSQSYFFDNLNSVTLASPTTTVALSGSTASLTFWKAGDRVATSSAPFGIATDAPPSAFSSFMNQGLDYLEWSTDDFPNEQIATISAVPEPAAIALFLSGLTLVFCSTAHVRRMALLRLTPLVTRRAHST